MNEALTNLLEQYQKVNREKVSVVKEINDKIDELIKKRDELSLPFDNFLKSIESQIRPVMLVYQQTFVSPYGKILYRKGYERRIWNSDALDSICEAESLIKTVIWPHRKVIFVEPSIKVEVVL